MVMSSIIVLSTDLQQLTFPSRIQLLIQQAIKGGLRSFQRE